MVNEEDKKEADYCLCDGICPDCKKRRIPRKLMKIEFSANDLD